MIFQLVYRSTASRHLPASALLHLLERSRAHNARLEITGMLLFHSGQFLQMLEGEVVLTLNNGTPPTSIRLRKGDRQAIPPGVSHALSLEGPVRFTIDFLGRQHPESGQNGPSNS